MKDLNESLEVKEFDEANAESRFAVELEERQELAWISCVMKS